MIKLFFSAKMLYASNASYYDSFRETLKIDYILV